jgi:hypothetical protein
MKKRASLASVALAACLAACSTSQTQQFATNAAADAAAIGQVNTAMIQLNATVIANQTQLAQALAQTYCPIVNASVALGAAIQADPNVAKNVQAALTKAGPTGALASDICAAAGFGPTSPATAAPAGTTTPTAAGSAS